MAGSRSSSAAQNGNEAIGLTPEFAVVAQRLAKFNWEQNNGAVFDLPKGGIEDLA